MYHAFGNALVIEVENLLAKMKILQQGRTARALLQSVLTIGDRNALLGGQGLDIAARHMVQLAAGAVCIRVFFVPFCTNAAALGACDARAFAMEFLVRLFRMNPVSQ